MFLALLRSAKNHLTALGRRATIEQAKGILMARHAIDADRAFAMLRDHSQHNGRKLVDVAAAVVESHLLLLPPISESGIPPPHRVDATGEDDPPKPLRG